MSREQEDQKKLEKLCEALRQTSDEVSELRAAQTRERLLLSLSRRRSTLHPLLQAAAVLVVMFVGGSTVWALSAWIWPEFRVPKEDGTEVAPSGIDQGSANRSGGAGRRSVEHAPSPEPSPADAAALPLPQPIVEEPARPVEAQTRPRSGEQRSTRDPEGARSSPKHTSSSFPAVEPAIGPRRADEPGDAHLRTSAEVAPPDPVAPIAIVEKERILYDEAHRLHFVRRDFGGAVQAWERYLSEHPAGRFIPEAQWNRAIALLRTGHRERAIEELRAIATGQRGGRHRQRDARSLLEAMGVDVP